MSVLPADRLELLAPRAFPLVWLAAPALLALSRLLPAHGLGLGLRLAAATVCLLIPGAIVARALGLSGLAPAFTWSLATLAVGMMVMFAVHGSIWLALGVMVGVSACAAPFALRRSPSRIAAWSLAVLGLGVAAGIAFWWVAAFGGDSFFHLARVRKLVDFHSISLRSLDEYKDGGLHPGYAFPLWHGFLALVSKLSGVDPTQVVLHGPTVLMPLSFLLTYESGVALFRSHWAGLSTLLASFALLGLAPGHGGTYVSLALAGNASRLLVLPALLAEELLRRALADPERGLDDPPPVQDAALAMLAHRSGGDARVALSALERAVERAGGEQIDVAAAEDALQRKALEYDREGDRHYDFVSAWIKATRGSDVDASLYYLAVMLEGGEDPRFIARRMVILASEDVGNADPQALLVADAAARAVDRVGLPECAHNLAQAAVYLALAPKSNASYKALGAARAEVRENGARTPPDYLRDAHYPGAKKLGRGEGYRYAHDEPGGVSDQQLIPDGLRETDFYTPTDRGFEAELGRRLDALRRKFRDR